MIEQVCLNDLFLESAKEIFETMIFMDILLDDQPDRNIDGDAVLGSISFKGDMEGCLAICCELECAQVIAMNMLGFDSPDEIADEDTWDAIGEVVNMVMGCVKKRLYERHRNLEISIPVVAKGYQLKNNLRENAKEVVINVMIEDQYPAVLSLLYREKLN